MARINIRLNRDRIGWPFGRIFAGAFTSLGIAGGRTGALIQMFR